MFTVRLLDSRFRVLGMEVAETYSEALVGAKCMTRAMRIACDGGIVYHVEIRNANLKVLDSVRIADGISERIE